MPYFARQIAQNGGLMVVALVGVSHARRTALVGANQTVPNPVRIDAMIDTGASCTCIDPWALDQLGISPTGSTTVNTPTTGDTPVVGDLYDVSLTIYSVANQPPLMQHTMPVLRSELLVRQGFHALIGRDILQLCHLTYDGQNGIFTLAY